MKCPYREFQDCVVEQCPSCNYEEIKETVISGRAPYWMSDEEAISRGNKWRETVKTYKFISCKLIDNGVQPIPATKQVINNTTKTNVSIKKSIF
jgi:hypothetical protein